MDLGIIKTSMIDCNDVVYVNDSSKFVSYYLKLNFMKKITLLAIAFIITVTFQIQAQETEIILTQSVTQKFIKGAVSCYGGDNAWYREYILSDEGITTDVKVVGIQFGLEFITLDEELEIYAYSFSGFPFGFDSANAPTPIASGRITVGESDLGGIIRADFDAPVFVSAGSSIVVSIMQPAFSGNPVYLGVTEQETKTSFTIANNCGVVGQPQSVSAIGFPDARHMIDLIVVDETLSLKNNLFEKITMFPNPTNGNLNLKAPSHIQILNVKLFDVLGKNVGVSFHKQILKTANLPQGVYILKVETSHGALTKKFVKQ